LVISPAAGAALMSTIIVALNALAAAAAETEPRKVS
jgi:hypothetical protein